MFQAEHLEYDKNGQILLNGQRFKIKDNVAITIAGDIIKDFFDRTEAGLEEFLSKTIIEKSGFTNEESERFKVLYHQMMEKSGITEDKILRNDPSLYGENGKFNTFYYNLMGITEPQFMTLNEKAEFVKSRKELYLLLKKGMKNFAKKQYQNVRDVLEKYNLNSDQVVMVAGNHDLPAVMKEVLGDYVISEGEVKEIGGLKFMNLLDLTTGNFIGSDFFNDLYGYAGFQENIREYERHSESFKRVQKKLFDVGINIDSRDMIRYMEQSIEKARFGIGTGDAGRYKQDYIKPEISVYLEDRLKRIEQNITQKDTDLFLVHSMLDDPRASIEEQFAHKILGKYKPNSVVLHGHMHSPTPHMKDNVIYLNQGSSLSGNSSVHLLDENKSYHSTLFKSTKDLRREYKHLTIDDLPDQSQNRA